jgi:hypothetical protein
LPSREGLHFLWRQEAIPADAGGFEGAANIGQRAIIRRAGAALEIREAEPGIVRRALAEATGLDDVMVISRG